MATRFLTRNYADTSSFTTSNYTFPSNAMFDELPIENVTKLSKSLVARSRDATPLTIYGSLVDVQTINSLVICGHNFSIGTSVAMDLYADDSFTPANWLYGESFTIDQYSEGQDIYDGISYLPFWFTDIGIKAFKITIFNSATYPTNYFQIYRLCVGNAITTRVGAALNNSITYADKSLQYRTESGTLRTDNLKAHKRIEFDLTNLVESERPDLVRTLADVGKQKEFFISVFDSTCNSTKDYDYRGLVKLIRVPRYVEYANNIYSSKILVEEV